MAERAKHAFGMLENIDTALSKGTIDSYDILFVKDANGKPYVGWIDKEGQKVICDDSAEFAELEAEIAKKVNADEVDAKYEEIKYEITDVPVGTLVNYRDGEIRICCASDAEYHLQSVGSGGDANTYYVTLKTYCYDDNVVGYKETLNGQSDAEILTDLREDAYGRRYQPTWLGVAKYDETSDTWTYYGASSTASKMIGWDYTIQFFDANNVMIASNSVRINLSNEDCHSSIKPYYGASETEVIEATVEEVVEEKVTVKVEEAVTTANAYTDAQIEAKLAEIEEAVSYEIVEF